MADLEKEHCWFCKYDLGADCSHPESVHSYFWESDLKPCRWFERDDDPAPIDFPVSFKRLSGFWEAKKYGDGSVRVFLRCPNCFEKVTIEGHFGENDETVYTDSECHGAIKLEGWKKYGEFSD